jgi:hypothetical protein
MMIRQKGFRIDDKVRLRDPENYGSGNAYPLPDGWHDGQAVTVLSFDRGWAVVRDEAGRETEVYLINLDTGWEEEYALGKWRDRIKSPSTASASRWS